MEAIANSFLATGRNAKFFFTHPYSSWEKGLIENTNKLIRQYIPKKANFDDFNEKMIKEIQYKINNMSQNYLTLSYRPERKQVNGYRYGDN
jgi:IS30 family transposase